VLMTEAKIVGVAVTNSLIKQTDALVSYLDEMLHDATVLAADSISIDQFDKSIVKHELIEFTLTSELVTEKPTLKKEQLSELDKLYGVEPLNGIRKSESALKVESRVSIDLKLNHNKPCRVLDIKQFPIRCLMFRVGDNLLSIPLIEMMGVVQWTDKLTQLPQSGDEVLGILKYRDTYLKVLDSLIVLGITAERIQKPGYVLMLSDKKVAISCDTLEDVISLEYDDIQWYKAPENNTIQGIIKESLAHLLNPYRIINSVKIST
jgi:chemotaxis signal transduction protein